eukprot:TRINITY_DN159_c0_g1_i17.p1 TRINITY_DN159_c0_g1~~TRINITY_DN159_c0_g1_i17.p1  ORF type:complete len:187 (-),score=10.48 TRINITY_DN159_c0_g1_i17:18-578(-)
MLEYVSVLTNQDSLSNSTSLTAADISVDKDAAEVCCASQSVCVEKCGEVADDRCCGSVCLPLSGGSNFLKHITRGLDRTERCLGSQLSIQLSKGRLAIPKLVRAGSMSVAEMESIKGTKQFSTPVTNCTGRRDNPSTLLDNLSLHKAKTSLNTHKKDYVSEQYLSLIHICRCRRLLTCRSRWSPYH